MNVGELKSFLSGTAFLNADASKAGSIAEAQRQNASGRIAVDFSQSLQLNVSYQRVGAGVLNGQLLNRLQPVAEKADAQPKVEENSQLFDFEEVAKNVLSFVEQAMHKAKGKGADNEELASMFSQARSGIEQGFEQAIGELEEIGYYEELKPGIDKSYEAIQTGMDDLEERILGDVAAPGFAASIASSSYSYSREESQSLELTTADGDKVSLSFSSLQSAEYAETFAQLDTEEVQAQLSSQSASVYQGVNFSFSVEGELDEDEIEAISDLVQELGELSDEFFTGNPDEAFERALALDFDESEIAGFAYEHTLKERVQVTQAYQEVAGYTEKEELPIENEIVPISKYMQHLFALVESSQQKLSNGQDLASLANEVVGLQQRDNENPQAALDRFNNFNAKLINALSEKQA